MNTADIIVTWLDTPRLWSASRKDACGCPECGWRHGTGATPEQALIAMREEEEARETLRGIA